MLYFQATIVSQFFSFQECIHTFLNETISLLQVQILSELISFRAGNHPFKDSMCSEAEFSARLSNHQSVTQITNSPEDQTFLRRKQKEKAVYSL